jgi:hypothetical protein
VLPLFSGKHTFAPQRLHGNVRKPTALSHRDGVAPWPRSLIRERAGEGRKRAQAAGVKFGRKPKLSDYQRAEAIKRRNAGETLADNLSLPPVATAPASGLTWPARPRAGKPHGTGLSCRRRPLTRRNGFSHWFCRLVHKPY